LLGGLLGLGALSNNLELISMRASTISTAQIAVPIVKLALVLIATVILLQNLVIPVAEYHATQLRSKTLIVDEMQGLEDQPDGSESREFWTKHSGQFIRFGRVLPDRSLSGVEIYQFDGDGNLAKLLQTPRADLLHGNTWLLRDVQKTSLQNTNSHTELMDTLVWETLLSEEQARTLITPASSLAPTDLWRSIQRLESNNMNSEPQKILFWNQMSIPLGILGMSLMSLPFLLGSSRSVPVGQRIAMGGLIGIVYYLVQQISGHVVGIMHWNVVLLVMTPGLLILSIAIVLLSRKV
jgi:lipopolysaccharide export system permease protein